MGCNRTDSLSCDELDMAMRDWLKSHRSCAVDADCTITVTGCATTADCGVFTNRSASGPYLSSLVEAFKKRRCRGDSSCPRCEAPPPTACEDGVCSEARKAAAH